MKIKVNDSIYDDVFVIDNEKTLQIIVSTDDVADLATSVMGATMIEVLDDDETVAASLSGTFVQPCLITDSSGKRLQFIKKIVSSDEWESLMQPVSVMFVQMAQDGTLDDITISEHPDLFQKWTENWTGKAGTILRDGDALYRSIHDITTTAQNTKPSETPSMWTMVADPSEEYPTWVQPIGAHDAYVLGDKVSHNDKHWTSTVDDNVWEPGIYGWEEVV